MPIKSKEQVTFQKSLLSPNRRLKAKRDKGKFYNLRRGGKDPELVGLGLGSGSAIY